MRVSNKMPSKSFEETGFYVSSFPNWRYTGRYGLVKHNIPLEELPKPYGGEIRALDEIMFHILALPIYIWNDQLDETFEAFFNNISSGYFDDRSYYDDLNLLPYALVDFLPALFTSIVAILAPVWLVIFFLDATYDENDQFAFALTLALSPLIAAAGVLLTSWELIGAALMFYKAGLETGFAVLNILSIPIKGIAIGIYNLFDKDKTEGLMAKTNP